MRRILPAAMVTLLAIYVCAFLLGAPVMASYLAAWLFCLSVPVGALPLVMGLELVGLGGSLHTGFLRWLLILLPVASLAGLPLLFFLPALYPWAAHAPHGFAGMWFAPAGFILRSVIYLALWNLLALLNLRPPALAPRRGLCSAGLALHAVVGTLAATDWIASLAPGLNAAGFGLMVMAGQSALALSVALLFVPGRPRHAGAWLLAALFAWGVLQFTQYLIVWSADRPEQIAWYMHRDGPLGMALAWAGAATLLALAVLLAPATLAARPLVLTACAALVLAVQMLVWLWLVTPSLRGVFVLSPSDLALPVLALLSAAFLWALRPRPVLR